jgi:hypothetical protein
MKSATKESGRKNAEFGAAWDHDTYTDISRFTTLDAARKACAKGGQYEGCYVVAKIGGAWVAA